MLPAIFLIALDLAAAQLTIGSPTSARSIYRHREILRILEPPTEQSIRQGDSLRKLETKVVKVETALNVRL